MFGETLYRSLGGKEEQHFDRFKFYWKSNLLLQYQYIERNLHQNIQCSHPNIKNIHKNIHYLYQNIDNAHKHLHIYINHQSIYLNCV